MPVRICPTTNLIPVPCWGDRDAVDRGGEGAVPDGLVRHDVPEDELLVLAAGEELQEKKRRQSIDNRMRMLCSSTIMLMLLECQVSLATVLESNPFRMRELFKAEFRIR